MLAILIITLFMVALYMGLMQYYAWGWVLTPTFQPKLTYQPNTKVTVLVPARNEATIIEQVLKALLAQTYPKDLLEIVMIDDNSEDETANIAWGMTNASAVTWLNVISLPQNLSGKKAALAHGVNHASGELIITTDADCTMGADWVSSIVEYYETHHYKVLTGPVVFNKVHGPSSMVHRLLYYFQSLDLMGLMFITAGSLRFKFPHMANGANFAFEKKLFEAIGGYNGIDKSPSGDDILFLLKAHSHHPGCAGFIKSKAAIVVTDAAATWPAFWQQRLRWVSKSTGFGDVRLTMVMTFYYLYALAIVVFGIWACLQPIMLLPFGILLLGKLLPELVMLAHATAFFGRTRELVWFLPAQLLHVYYVLRIGIEAQLRKYVWKGRSY
ncbi:glycosyltransferase [soil metagenome]